MDAFLRRASLAAAAAVSLCGVVRGGEPPTSTNVLVVIADDLGVEMVGAYGVGTPSPATPTIDQLAADGVRFLNAYSHARCSPSRASMLTGRHPSRHGVGTIIGEESLVAFSLDEVTLPELLDLGTGGAWAHAAFGKWHLGSDLVGGVLAPNRAGFAHFDGSMCSLNHKPSKSYFDWQEVVNGVATQTTAYNTTAIVDSALAWIADAPEPWLAWVGFNAPHAPYHAPPAGTYSVDLSGAGPPSEDPRPYYEAMVESLDTELGRLLASMDADVLARTTVVFVGDNGTPPVVIGEPYLGYQGKGTVFEGGVHVPLIVTGPFVAAPGSTSEALVHAEDVFATVADIAGVDPALVIPEVALDALSLLPHLADPAALSSRPTVFAETFEPNTFGGATLPEALCQFDLGYAGPGTASLQACGAPLFEDAITTLALAGGPPNAPGFFVFGLSINPVRALGGTVVPLPIVLLAPIVTSPRGAIAVEILGAWSPATYPFQAYVQGLVRNDALPKGWSITNALAIQFYDGVSAQRMLRDSRFKLMRAFAEEGVIVDRFFDLVDDPFEKVDLLVPDGVAGLDPVQLAAYTALEAELQTWFEP